jgi:transposase InsO family protein
MLFAIGVATLVLGALLFVIRWIRGEARRDFRRPRPAPTAHGFNRKKPDWVPKAVVRLKALMPKASCRHVATAFQSRYGHRGESVGKNYVATIFKKRALAIHLLHRKIKNRVTRQGPRNLIWAADLTFVPEPPRPVLGVIDHGTRALMVVKEMRVRTTIAVLRVLLDCFERFGRPRFLRTDNEGFFASPLFTATLFILGIRHQRIDPYCPWQNGRIERLFWTLKERLLAWWDQAGVPNDVQLDLDTFRVWYDHVRPHQGLAGLTPAEAWSSDARRGRLRFFSAWNGILTGFGRPT